MIEQFYSTCDLNLFCKYYIVYCVLCFNAKKSGKVEALILWRFGARGLLDPPPPKSDPVYTLCLYIHYRIKYAYV